MSPSTTAGASSTNGPNNNMNSSNSTNGLEDGASGVSRLNLKFIQGPRHADAKIAFHSSFKRYRGMWTTSDLSYNAVSVLSHFMNLTQLPVGILSVTVLV